MITKLKHADRQVAEQIYSVFQRSYEIEAKLIGTKDFPPLKRSAETIAGSKTEFYGYLEDAILAAVIEIEVGDGQLEIHSLTVDPAFFRKGLAGKMISNMLTVHDFNIAKVETALVNQPAINLYKKYGFVVYKSFTPSHGIRKVAMMRKGNT